MVQSPLKYLIRVLSLSDTSAYLDAHHSVSPVLTPLSPHRHPTHCTQMTHFRPAFKQELCLFAHFLVCQWGNTTYLTKGIRGNNKPKDFGSMAQTQTVLKCSFPSLSPYAPIQAPVFYNPWAKVSKAENSRILTISNRSLKRYTSYKSLVLLLLIHQYKFAEW